jgi:hypothetical protein
VCPNLEYSRVSEIEPFVLAMSGRRCGGCRYRSSANQGG